MKKGQTILISITAAFIGVLIGLFIGRTMITPVHRNNKSVSSTVLPAETKSNTTGKLNVNIATSEQLMELPGIGKGLAENIIQYREENGDFENIDELLNVKGIGQSRLENLKDYLYVPD